eukprot:TRINITY_DN19234_c0_g1_i1.p1 TRINITY_DN19234_c0_g1~~TRINITY_DN19234_c0_g1_i1.p1  ORF type:complete len:874 (+),score=148.06 TRINITY_DN19234_c0_g1_i1:37-2622(+)
MPTDNELIFNDLLENDSYLSEPNGEVDIVKHELQKSHTMTEEELQSYLRKRCNQQRAVVEMVNMKVKGNYTRFVEGINKIHEVGTCSEQTTAICDRGKSRLHMTKNMVVAALSVSQRQRRKVNMRRAQEVLKMIRRARDLQKMANRLTQSGEHADAVISIVKGLQGIEEDTIDIVDHVPLMRQLLASLYQMKKNIFENQLEKSMTDCCDTFHAWQFQKNLTAVTICNAQDKGADQLIQKWKQVVNLTSLASIRGFALKNSCEAETERASFGQLMRKLHSDDVIHALITLFSNLAHAMWNFTAMLNWLSQAQEYASWFDKLTHFKQQFASLIESKVHEFLVSCQFHSLKLQSFRNLVVSYRMFSTLMASFSASPSNDLESLMCKAITKYLSEVFHKEVTEVTRMGILHETGESVEWEDCDLKKEDGMALSEKQISSLCRLCNDYLDDDSETVGNPFVTFMAAATSARMRQNSDSPLGAATGPSIDKKLLRCAHETISNIETYKELIDAFPTASGAVGSLLMELGSLFVYLTISSFCNVPQAGADKKENKDKDRSDSEIFLKNQLPSHIQENLNEIKTIALKYIPKEINIDTNEPKATATPQVQSANLRHILNSRLDLFGIVPRHAALDSASAVLTCISNIWNSDTHHRQVQSTQSLIRTTKHISKVTTKRLSMIICPCDSYPRLIQESKWEPKALESDPSMYTHVVLKDLRKVSDRLSDSNIASQLPDDVPYRLWTCIVDNVWCSLVEGFSRVKKCSDEGRALMALDVKTIQHALKGLVPGNIPSAEPVDEFVRAFYLDTEGYLDWVRNSHARYTTKQLTSILTINTNVIDRKRKEKQEEIRKLEDELQRLDHRDRMPFDIL